MDEGAQHTDMYSTQGCRVHVGYRAQKGAASIGVLGVQALLQQLLAAGWSSLVNRQLAGAEPCRDAGALLPPGTPSPLKSQDCLLGDKGWGQAMALSSPSLLPPPRPAVPALLPTNSCASLVSCFIREPHWPSSFILYVSPWVSPLGAEDVPLVPCPQAVWVSAPHAFSKQCCPPRRMGKGLYPALHGHPAAGGSQAESWGSLFNSALCQLSKISQRGEQQRLKLLKCALVCR